MIYHVIATPDNPIPGLKITTNTGWVEEYAIGMAIPESQLGDIKGAKPLYKDSPDNEETDWVMRNANKINGTKPPTVYEWYLQAFYDRQVCKKKDLDELICRLLNLKRGTARISDYTIRVYVNCTN